MTDTARRYDAVFWDIGGVIIELASIREGYAAFLGELAEEHDLDPEATRDRWKAALGEHFRAGEGTEYQTAREGYRKATEAVFEAAGREPPAESEWRPVLERCSDETLRTEPGAVETIRALDEAGVYQAVISDVDTAEAESMFEQLGIADHFAHVTTSEAVGYKKPDSRMFETALAKAADHGIDPADGVMVGDRYGHDIEGASALGLSAIAYGEDAAGAEADHVVTDLRDILEIVGVSE
ncbi:HAD family hydrolase [Haloglomus litoreum]|uniref:HAD family hydrolase n=1 Tax=Haloglomus litoreum TaxID=3034026 RepID=UPI0023E8EF29|nr:HAD family hydrolase [Haloglomus sp. DT116]